MAPPSGHSLLLICVLGILALDRFTRGQKNGTLIFTRENTIRKCRCSADIRDCDYSLASLMCSCKTILPFAVENQLQWPSDHLVHRHICIGPPVELHSGPGPEAFSVQYKTLPTEYLAICGLKRLRINTEAKHPSPEQSLLIRSSGEHDPREKPPLLHTGWQTCMYVSFLDMALFNRQSTLKSYSIENVASIANNFPYFSHFKTFPVLSNKSYVVTFIY